MKKRLVQANYYRQFCAACAALCVALCAALCATVLLGSCAPKEQANSAAGDPDKAVYGYMIRDGRALYRIREADGVKTAEWAANLDLGERVRVLEEGVRASTSDAEYTFVGAARDGEGIGGYIIDLHVAVGAERAVVTEKSAYLYKSPRFSGVWSYELPRGTVIAYWPESEIDGFVKIQAFYSYGSNNNVYFPQTNASSVPEVFILLESISVDQGDVEAAILLYRALNTQSESQRTALINSGLRGYPGSAFTGELNALQNPGGEAPAEDSASFRETAPEIIRPADLAVTPLSEEAAEAPVTGLE
jgi:hypothetical protein